MGLAILLVLTIPALWLNSGQYAAVAAAVQAFGVVVAFGLATETLITDSRDKKTDRTLDLHAELVSAGPLNAARVRLVDHLRKYGSDGEVTSATRDELTPERGRFSAYSDGATVPIHDANLILRFFERANAARVAGIVDYPLFHELLAGHALWWQLAILEGEQIPIRLSLSQLALWADDYAETHPEAKNYMAAWERNLVRDFGDRRKVRYT